MEKFPRKMNFGKKGEEKAKQSLNPFYVINPFYTN